MNIKTTAFGAKKLSVALGLAALLIQGCSDKPKEEAEATTTVVKETKQEVAPQNLYGVNTQQAPQEPSANADIQVNAPHVAKVLETADAAGYTYVKVDEDGNIYWIAGPKSVVTKGESISYVEQMVMQDFTSKALDKTFDRLMFTTMIIPAGGASSHASTTQEHDCDTCGPDGKPKTAEAPIQNGSKQKAVQLDDIKVAKAAGGYSVEELHTKSAELKGKTVKVQAKVVKVSKAIMGKDWVHIQDGTGSSTTSDIIITGKNTTVAVGDVVTAEAVLNTDVDFGYGYFFAVILEEGKFTKQ